MSRSKVLPSICTALICASALTSQVSAAIEPQKAKGDYMALVDGGSYATSGFVKATFSPNGIGTVSVQLGDSKVCVLMVGPEGGSLGGSLVFGGTFSIIRTGDPDMSANLTPVDNGDGTITITGTVSDDGVEIPVTLTHSAPAGAAVPAGAYTFALGSAGSAESGVGTLLVNKDGKVRAIVSLASGRAVSATGQLDATGKCLLVSNPGKELLSGLLDFTKTPTSDFSATLSLRTPARGTTAETVQSFELTGSAYSKGANANWGQLAIAPDGYSHLAKLTRGGSYTVIGGGASLSLQKETGLLLGKFGKKKALRGAVLQAANAAQGFVEDGGTFTLTPTAPPVTASSGLGLGSTVNNSILSGGLTKSGAGTLTLSSSGSLSLSGGGSGDGTLQIAGGNLIAGGTIDLVTNRGGLVFTGGTIVNGSSAITGPGGMLTGSGAVNIGGGLNNVGSGSLILSGANTYAGSTIINGGTLTIGSGLTAPGNLLSDILIGPGSILTDKDGNTVRFADLHDGDVVTILGTAYQVTWQDPKFLLTKVPPVVEPPVTEPPVIVPLVQDVPPPSDPGVSP